MIAANWCQNCWGRWWRVGRGKSCRQLWLNKQWKLRMIANKHRTEQRILPYCVSMCSDMFLCLTLSILHHLKPFCRKYMKLNAMLPRRMAQAGGTGKASSFHPVRPACPSTDQLNWYQRDARMFVILLKQYNPWLYHVLKQSLRSTMAQEWESWSHKYKLQISAVTDSRWPRLLVLWETNE